MGLVRDGDVITIAALMPRRQPVGSRFPVGFGVAGWVAATGRPAEIQDVRQDKRYVALPYPEVRSFVGVPLQSGGDLLGVLSLAAWTPGAFAAHTADALLPFGEAAALLLRSAAEREVTWQRLETLGHAANEGLAESLHELKAPLHAASGFLDLVASEQAGPLNEQQKDFLQTARGECARLKDALATLVEAGASAAQRPLTLQLVQPGELVETSVERLHGQATGRQVRLVAEVDPLALAVRGDRPALLQVLANFLQNALRLVPIGSEIVVHATAGKPGWTQFVVADRGPGVAEQDLESIFDRFAKGGLATPSEPPEKLASACPSRVVSPSSTMVRSGPRTARRAARVSASLCRSLRNARPPRQGSPGRVVGTPLLWGTVLQHGAGRCFRGGTGRYPLGWID